MTNNAEKKSDKSVKFSKEQIIDSSRFAGHRDLVCSLLEDGKEYTLESVDQMIEKFLKGKVK